MSRKVADQFSIGKASARQALLKKLGMSRKVADRFSIGKASARQALLKKLGMSKVSARWVPKWLTEDQKASRVTIAKEHLGCLNHDENKFLNVNVTVKELIVL